MATGRARILEFLGLLGVLAGVARADVTYWFVDQGEVPGQPHDRTVHALQSSTVCFEYYVRSDADMVSPGYQLLQEAPIGGDTGMVPAYFNGPTVTFRDLDYSERRAAGQW